MGTSTSHPGRLVPPWADGPADPPASPRPGDPPTLPPELPAGGDDEEAPGDSDADGDGEDNGGGETLGGGQPPARIDIKPFRRALRKFANSGDRQDLAKAIRQYGRTFRPKGGTSRPSPAVMSVAGVIEVLERLSRGEVPDVPGVRIADLEGQPIGTVAVLLVQALTPDEAGFEDELMQAAMADAMSKCLGEGAFSAAAIDLGTVAALVCAFVTQLVFKYLWLDIRPVAETLSTAAKRRDLEDQAFDVVRGVVERACEERRCAPLIERKSKAEIAVLLRDLASKAATYLGDWQCD